MSRLRIRALLNVEEYVKAVYEKKITNREGKRCVDDQTESLLKQLKYGEYGTNVIRRNTSAPRGDRDDFRLRGVIGSVRMVQVGTRLEDLNAVAYRCGFFSLWFYPVDHFLAMARKSKPAIHFHYQRELFLNGRIPGMKNKRESHAFARSDTCEQFMKKWGRVVGVQGSLIPKHWAYMRVRARKWARPVFREAWDQFRGPDGVYLYKIEVFPDRFTRKEFEKHIHESVRAVTKLDMAKFTRDKRGRNWVEHVNSRVSLKSLNGALANESIPFRYERSKGTD